MCRCFHAGEHYRELAALGLPQNHPSAVFQCTEKATDLPCLVLPPVLLGALSPLGLSYRSASQPVPSRHVAHGSLNEPLQPVPSQPCHSASPGACLGCITLKVTEDIFRRSVLAGSCCAGCQHGPRTGSVPGRGDGGVSPASASTSRGKCTRVM